MPQHKLLLHRKTEPEQGKPFFNCCADGPSRNMSGRNTLARTFPPFAETPTIYRPANCRKHLAHGHLRLEPGMKTSADAARFLMDRLNYERTPARRGDFYLERMEQLLQRIDNPQRCAPVIHLAGTKGKGSTAALLSQVLTAGGLKVGLYTSPHFVDIEERLQIDNQPCRSDELVRLTQQIAPVALAMDEAGESPTFFELATALAFLHFQEQGVDVMVLETGLGGRLDSTNVCDPLVSVITSISFDHTRQLGGTLAKISREKCGIIKPQRPVVSGVEPEEPASVVIETCEQRESPLHRLGVDFQARDLKLRGAPDPATTFDYISQRRSLPDLSLGLLGAHQVRNAALALATLELLEDSELPYTFDESTVRKALASARLPGRIEVIGERPTRILDVAHNEASVVALIETLNACYSRDAANGQMRRLVLAISRDKDADAILRTVAGEFDDIVITRFVTNPRAIEPAELQERLESLCEETKRHPTLTIVEEPNAAWQFALDRAEPDDLICATGSFFLIAELKAH